MTQIYESFRIKKEIMDELREYLIQKAAFNKKTKMHGLIREGIENIIKEHLDMNKDIVA